MGVFGRRVPYLRLTMSPSVMSLAAAATLGGVRRLSRPNCISSDRVLPSKFLVQPDHHFPKPMLYFRQRSIQIFVKNCRLQVERALIYDLRSIRRILSLREVAPGREARGLRVPRHCHRTFLLLHRSSYLSKPLRDRAGPRSRHTCG